MELGIEVEGTRLAATLDLPTGQVRGAVVILHGAQAGHRSYFCYTHLAQILPDAGIAVLRYERRPRIGGHDVPLADQADDAAAAIAVLRRYVGAVPIGLWGWSQGAWVAPLTAVRNPGSVAFLILVSCSGVSPAAQMRYGTAEQLRQHGFTDADLVDLDHLRGTVEEYLRGHTGRASAQQAVDLAAARPWFRLAWLPRELPTETGTWTDMDFDPEPVFARANCPVLLFYGATDAWVPVDASIAAWRRAAITGALDLTICRLDGCDHLPSFDEREDIASISSQYSTTLVTWLESQLSTGAADRRGPEKTPRQVERQGSRSIRRLSS
ncbi:alpha/beta hydrolase [Micromonospora arida]|uniref:alpha/beta hydrolase n=1 Tax=Micromonospora arida TaxID=2203715 RepID=UPI0034076E18